jgi:hypothetical protein
VDQPLTFGGQVPKPPDWDAGAVMLLSDGGIVNNLGTQPLREDRFFRGKDDNAAVPQVLLSANASAPMRARHAWPYYVPGIAVISQLVRCLQMLNVNTVAPRVGSTRLLLKRRAAAGSYNDDVDLIVNLSEDSGLLEVSLQAMIEEHRDIQRLRNPKRRRWQAELTEFLRAWVDEHPTEPIEPDTIGTLVGTIQRRIRDEPWDTPKTPGILDQDAIDDVTQTAWWGKLTELEASYGKPQVPTTLGRLNPQTIRMLVLRGYMHTYLASLAIRPWSSVPWPSDRLNDASSRIADRITSLAV